MKNFDLLILILMIAAPAVAQRESDLSSLPVTRAEIVQMLLDGFAQLDANHDGFLQKSETDSLKIKYTRFRAAVPDSLSLEEFKAPFLDRFDALDTDHNGMLSLEERVAGEKTAANWRSGH